jgi:hypothetical protein
MRRIAILLFFALSAFAADDKTKVVSLTHALEAHPLAENARESRTWLVTYIAAAPDIEVVLCAAPLHDLVADQHYKYSSELTTQTMFGQAAYLIEHPKADPRSDETLTAGMASMLKAYQSIVAKDASAKRTYLDALLDPAALAAHMKAHGADCRK